MNPRGGHGGTGRGNRGSSLVEPEVHQPKGTESQNWKTGGREIVLGGKGGLNQGQAKPSGRMKASRAA